MEYFLNRPLTPQETILRNQKRCIACGVKVNGRIQDGIKIQPFECKDCTKTRTNMPLSNASKEQLKIVHTVASLTTEDTVVEPDFV